MLDLQGLNAQDLRGLSSSSLAEVAAQMLARIGEQSKFIGEQGRQLDERNKQIAEQAQAISLVRLSVNVSAVRKSIPASFLVRSWFVPGSFPDYEKSRPASTDRQA